MSSNPVMAPPTDTTVSRRGFFMKLGILFNGFAAMVLAVPVWGFFFRRLRAVVRAAISRGCHSVALTSFLKAKRAWLRFKIHT